MTISRRSVILGFLALVALYLFRLGAAPLIDPDEGRYAEIAREMVESGDWLVPRLDGVPYLEKPPLVYWLIAGSLRLIHDQEFGARLPNALFTLGAALLIYLLLRRENRLAAAIGALAAGLNLYSFGLGRLVTLDAGLAFFTTAAGVCLYQATRREEKGEPFLAWTRGGYLACALGVMVKGFIALLPGLGFGLYLILTGRLKKSLRFRPWEAIILALGVSLPWVLMMEARMPGFIRMAVWDQQVLRFVQGPVDHSPTPAGEALRLILGITFLGLLPWLVPFLTGTFAVLRRPRLAGAGLFALTQLAAVYFFVAVSSVKLPTYLLPAWPWAAALIGLGLAGAAAESSPPSRPGWPEKAGLILAALIIGVVLPVALRPLMAKYMVPAGSAFFYMLIAGGLGLLVPLLPGVGFRGKLLAYLGGAAALMVMGIDLYPRYAELRSTRREAGLIKDRGLQDVPLYLYCGHFPSAQFYLRRQLPLVRYGLKGELRGGAPYVDNFPEVTETEFLARFNSPEPTLALVTDDCYDGLRGKRPGEGGWSDRDLLLRPPEVLDDRGSIFLILNQPASAAVSGGE